MFRITQKLGSVKDFAQRKKRRSTYSKLVDSEPKSKEQVNPPKTCSREDGGATQIQLPKRFERCAADNNNRHISPSNLRSGGNDALQNHPPASEINSEASQQPFTENNVAVSRGRKTAAKEDLQQKEEVATFSPDTAVPIPSLCSTTPCDDMNTVTATLTPNLKYGTPQQCSAGNTTTVPQDPKADSKEDLQEPSRAKIGVYTTAPAPSRHELLSTHEGVTTATTMFTVGPPVRPLTVALLTPDYTMTEDENGNVNVILSLTLEAKYNASSEDGGNVTISNPINAVVFVGREAPPMSVPENAVSGI